jgi:LPXTG-site transpeptidase (sortase) family protein
LNIPTGDYEDSDGSIQINKYTCPTGYDLHASGANPYADCTDGANGIEFLLDGASSQVTGQVLFGAVRWEGLSTSTYTVTEDVPLDIGFVFVMSCEGNSIPMIQGFPLSTGPSLDIPLQSGDHIVCSWYNVPAPEGGTVTVIKYACVGEVFVSVDDCQIFEDGQGFALSHFNGSTWEEVAFGTTNAQGVLSFTGLAEGLYQVDEIDGTWCHAVADSTNADGYLVVGIGQETTLQVYNCGVKLLKVPPTTYPNTGAGAQPHSLNLSAAPVLPADAPGMLEPHQWTGVLDSRLIAPFLSGDKPVRVEIEAIGLDAAVETLEIIDGAFQDPTTSDQVAWYKDTARLGEDGNLVMAGHLNYWGDRVGVFFALDQVEKGDEIAVTAEDGTVYRYSVTEVSLQPANSASLQAITQEAGGQTLTLITCGGEWDPASKSYLQRTVLQAELEDRSDPRDNVSSRSRAARSPASIISIPLRPPGDFIPPSRRMLWHY